jgi:carboxyl-terminal processing protease
VIDLRDNAGGLLTAAVGICDLFLESGAIVSTRGRGGLLGPENRGFTARPDLALDKSIPITVLSITSRQRPQIMAACLQDHRRASSSAAHLAGNGPEHHQLEGDAAETTTASYWRCGRNIHRLKDAKDTDEWGQPDDSFDVLVPDDELRKVYRYRGRRDISDRPSQLARRPVRQAVATRRNVGRCETVRRTKPMR